MKPFLSVTLINTVLCPSFKLVLPVTSTVESLFLGVALISKSLVLESTLVVYCEIFGSNFGFKFTPSIIISFKSLSLLAVLRVTFKV